MDAVTLQEATTSRVEGVFHRLEEIVPEIRARRAEIEAARQMPRDLIDRLRGTGVFRLGVPRALGGMEATPAELIAAVETVAAADGSAGWCTMIGTANGVSAGYMPEAGAREMFADPSAPTAGIAAPEGRASPVEGGVRVSGRWGFASGITHVDWVWAGCLVMEGDEPRMTPAGPEVVHVCLPAAEVKIHDTWRVSGLSGTGSHHFSCSGLFVPERRTFSLLDGSTHRREPLYQMPPIGIFAYQLVAVGLGIARAALDELTQLAQSKVPTLSPAVLADRTVAQVEIARAEGRLGAARAFLYQAVQEVWQAVSAERTPTRRQLALARIAAAQAAEAAAEITRTANVLAGGSSIYAAAPLQRHARDAEVVLHHFTVSPHVWEEAGRVLLGRDPIAPVF